MTPSTAAGIKSQWRRLHVTDSQDLNTITETRANSETSESSLSYSYTLSDDDEQDFYLVAVIPRAGTEWTHLLESGQRGLLSVRP